MTLSRTPPGPATDRTPRIVWPAPGLPAFIEGDRRSLRMLVEHDGGVGELQEWLAGLTLQEVASARPATLQSSAIRPYQPDARHPYAAEYLRERNDPRPLFEISLAVPRDLEPQAPRTATVFHLVRRGIVERARAVALLAENTCTLRLAFATDLHISHAWDAVGAAIDKYAPDLRDQFCHPQRLLAAFVKENNQRAARGELDLVVLGGDLVDHVYRTAHATTAAAADGNAQLLLDVLAPLTVPVVVIPGNHDYRVNPWRPRAFGLGSVGIAKHRQRSFLEPAGLWEPWRLLPSDRTALRTRDAEGRSGLLPHLSLLAPATDYSFDVRGLRLLFFATGRDVVLRWRDLDWQRRALLARALPTTWVDPDSEGPSNAQIRWLTAALHGARHVAMFFHAPILNPPAHVRVEEHLDHLHPGERDDYAAQVAFERRLQRSGLRGGTSFHNVAPLVRALLSVRGAMTTFSGHVHRSSRVDIDRDSLRVRSAPIASERHGTQIIPLHIGTSLGHVRSPGGEPPGYLLAEFEAGTLRAVQQRILDVKA